MYVRTYLRVEALVCTPKDLVATTHIQMPGLNCETMHQRLAHTGPERGMVPNSVSLAEVFILAESHYVRTYVSMAVGETLPLLQGAHTSNDGGVI